MALEALSALRAFGGLGAGDAMWQKGRTVTKERQALNQYYEDMATEGRAGLKAARDVSKRQGLGRFIGGVGGGILGFLGGGIAGATAGAGFGSKWGQEFGRKTGGGVGRITRGAAGMEDAPGGLFLSGRRREAGESHKKLMQQLTGTVSAGREAVKGRALQDALTAFSLSGGVGALENIGAGEAGWGSLFKRPDMSGFLGGTGGAGGMGAYEKSLGLDVVPGATGGLPPIPSQTPGYTGGGFTPGPQSFDLSMPAGYSPASTAAASTSAILPHAPAAHLFQPPTSLVPRQVPPFDINQRIAPIIPGWGEVNASPRGGFGSLFNLLGR
jgi:hypothetical protein